MTKKSEVMRAFLAVVTGVLLGFSVTACGGPGDPNKPTITAQQAAERAEQYVREFKSAFPDEATLELLSDSPGACTDSSGTKFDGRVEPGRTYWIRGLDPTKNNDYFDALKIWLPAHGWIVDTDSRPQDMFLHAYRTDDEFTMSLQTSNKGELSIGTSSPCVWPDGTPKP